MNTDDTPTQHTYNGTNFNIWPEVESEKIVTEPYSSNDEVLEAFNQTGKFKVEKILNGWSAHIEKEEVIRGSIDHFNTKKDFINHIEHRIENGVLD